MSAKFEDSNIANIGSKADHELRFQAAHKEHAWSNAGSSVGVQVWRIEKFQVHEWPKSKYGQFYSGDAYIVLKTYKPDPKSEKLAWNVHFWLGAQSSQDEQGTAAYKTVELDDYLNDTPVEYREVQGYESDLFHELFPHLIYIDGGIDSGFNHVKAEEYKPRLFKLSGSHKHIKFSQVPLSLSSLSSSSVYVLDLGLSVYQWNGSSSTSADSRRKADAVVHAIVEERDGKPKHKVLDGLEDEPQFWNAFGGKPASIPNIPEETSSSSSSSASSSSSSGAIERSLWKLSDETGSLQLTRLATSTSSGGPISRSQLSSEHVYLADDGVHLFVYVGGKAHVNERRAALNYGASFLTKLGKERANTPIVRIVEGTESREFDRIFH